MVAFAGPASEDWWRASHAQNTSAEPNCGAFKWQLEQRSPYSFGSVAKPPSQSAEAAMLTSFSDPHAQQVMHLRWAVATSLRDGYRVPIFATRSFTQSKIPNRVSRPSVLVRLCAYSR